MIHLNLNAATVSYNFYEPTLLHALQDNVCCNVFLYSLNKIIWVKQHFQKEVLDFQLVLNFDCSLAVQS